MTTDKHPEDSKRRLCCDDPVEVTSFIAFSSRQSLPLHPRSLPGCQERQSLPVVSRSSRHGLDQSDHREGLLPVLAEIGLLWGREGEKTYRSKGWQKWCNGFILKLSDGSETERRSKLQGPWGIALSGHINYLNRRRFPDDRRDEFYVREKLAKWLRLFWAVPLWNNPLSPHIQYVHTLPRKELSCKNDTEPWKNSWRRVNLLAFKDCSGSKEGRGA